MISLTQLGMTYGHKLLFFDVNLILNPGNTYALVGANGSGKSTLFKLIRGVEEVNEGKIFIPKNSSIGWLKQDQFRYENTIIRDIVLQGKEELWQALTEQQKLLNISEWNDKQSFRFAELEEIVAHNDGYNAKNEIERLLSGLGIAEAYFDKPLKALSGGYKLRVLLAQTLFQNPAILLLDEPTNHLDILSIKWLENFLNNEYKGLLIFISHDLDFINNLANYILDIDYGEIRQYPGNYAKFIEEKEKIAEQKTVEKKSAETKIADMQKFVDRFKAKASKASQAQARMKMIEKIIVPDVKNSSRIAPHFHFVPERNSGKQVIKIEKLSKSYGDKHLFTNLNLEIKRGEKLAIMGVNGIGKSTLLKIINNQVNPDSGQITWGHEVNSSYFSQDHHELLKEHLSVLNWLSNNIKRHCPEQKIRQALGQMLFTKDDVNKDILSLSGGEAARLLLAKVILESPNLLILDEPTNHMDLETISALAKALKNYAGTVIIISHNRYFVSKIASRILYFSTAHKIKDFKGSYAEFAATELE